LISPSPAIFSIHRATARCSTFSSLACGGRVRDGGSGTFCASLICPAVGRQHLQAKDHLEPKRSTRTFNCRFERKAGIRHGSHQLKFPSHLLLSRRFVSIP